MNWLTTVFDTSARSNRTGGGRIARLAAVLAALLVTIPLAGAPAAAAPAPIVGGENQTDADGLAAVLIDGGYQCTGSIVSNYWILTARHCLYSGSTRIADSRISVRVKSIHWYTGGGVVQVATSRVRANHDIAMLKLNRSANAESVRLPTATTTVGATTYAFGWGRTCLSCTPAPIVRRATQGVTHINGQLDLYGGRAIRTLGANGNVCFGDSGGPLFKLVDGLRYQVGVLSWGDSSCAGNGDYWATVPDSRDWILNVMATV
ncbi:trypsin-like serine protease [Micromonospora polyrhachis]|uniref:Secreted trypsin-like serine protease n=1 Tax=Micromonospora polyrhachis TaxID=1282883 RepID=A0A7W7WQY0_9ACTN|nr:trypsin-like serine protease [Micromonospora polyrhachis]MBB4959763.1 secreted trypsin-like serine protease [Micromonospora polyrhachis]